MSALVTPYAAPADQAWLRFWVGLYGPDSLLRGYLRELPPPPAPPPLPPAPLLRKLPRPHSARPAKPTQPPAERAARRIERDLDRVRRLPTAEWARRITGDPRINEITLGDVLEGIEDYFTLFHQMKKVDPTVYRYFARVGAPIVLANTLSNMPPDSDALTIAHAENLPSYFGMFLAKDNGQYRKSIIEDSTSLLDFHLFEKPKNHATVAKSGSVIFRHSWFCLSRDGSFTKEERKRYPVIGKNFAVWWFVGVQPDGQVRALPCNMSHYQRLPNGDGVHHSRFTIPPGLYKTLRHDAAIPMPERPHSFVRCLMNACVGFTAAATAGVQVTIRKGPKAARIGVPIAALKNFFADRDSEGRRRAILHFRPGHDRHMQDGRIIQVGEHLSGERFFSWRGYDIAVGVPGIHYPAPEGLNGPLWVTGDSDYAPLPEDLDHDDLMSITKAAKLMSRVAWRDRRVPIRRGEPTITYAGSALPSSPERSR